MTTRALRSDAARNRDAIVVAAGALRADATSEDVVVLLMANAGLVRSAHAAGTRASARLAHVLLDGVRAAAVRPAAPGPRRMAAAMRAQSRDLHLIPTDAA